MHSPTLLIAGRDDWQKDDSLTLALLESLRRLDLNIIWEDPASEIIYRYRRFERNFLPQWRLLQQASLRTIQTLYGLRHPSYFRYLVMRKRGETSARRRALKYALEQSGTADQTIVITRSSGGRITSSIADEVALKHVICLGYPFQHPQSGDEPERYQHLAAMQTPMHIVQGTRDCYGGREVLDKYQFSEHVKLMFVDTDHNFNVTSEVLEHLVRIVENAIEGR